MMSKILARMTLVYKACTENSRPTAAFQCKHKLMNVNFRIPTEYFSAINENVQQEFYFTFYFSTGNNYTVI